MFVTKCSREFCLQYRVLKISVKPDIFSCVGHTLHNLIYAFIFMEQNQNYYVFHLHWWLKYAPVTLGEKQIRRNTEYINVALWTAGF